MNQTRQSKFIFTLFDLIDNGEHVRISFGTRFPSPSCSPFQTLIWFFDLLPFPPAPSNIFDQKVCRLLRRNSIANRWKVVFVNNTHLFGFYEIYSFLRRSNNRCLTKRNLCGIKIAKYFRSFVHLSLYFRHGGVYHQK